MIISTKHASSYMRLLFSSALFFISINAYVQKDYDKSEQVDGSLQQVSAAVKAENMALEKIPPSFRSHPELGKKRPHDSQMRNSYELIHERTANSRTFIHPCGSLTQAFSDVPLHYKCEEGWWRSVELKFEADPYHKNTYLLNKKAIPMAFDAKNINSNVSFDEDNILHIRKALSLLQKDEHGALISKTDPGSFKADLKKDDAVVYVMDVFNGVDMTVHFDHFVIKRNYVVRSGHFLLPNTETVIIRELVEVPQGWSLTPDDDVTQLKKNQGINSLKLQNANGEIKTRFLRPIFTDAAPDRNTGTVAGFYNISQKNLTAYYVDIVIPASWLRDPSRIYPVTIDPVVIVDDSTVVPSCFHPNFQQSTLNINVPAGDFIFNTYLLWEFTAVTGSSAWMADQRSYVSGPSGQTGVFSGTGNNAGTQVYTAHTTIANGQSTGHVQLDFFASRVWGGSGCNANFNYIGRRYVEITHDTTLPAPGQFVVNEFSASNRQVLDEFGNYEDWVELYNASPNFIDITGYYLSDNPNNPTKWKFPGGLIPPGGHLVVVCSGRDTLTASGPHAGFRLTQLDPESVILSDTAGNVLESYTLFPLQNGHSYGRRTDGDSLWGIFANPTRGTANTGYYTGYSPKPVLSTDAGFYSTPVTVSINAPDPNVEIRYTTNGSTPTSTSTLYTGPITVSTTTVIRARTFSPDPLVLPGFIETNTYFINENHVLPVFSFSGDALNVLFGGSQIETIGAYEFFDENGTFIDASVGCFNKHGNDSWNYPQRGVDFIARDEYGYNDELEYKFFATSDRTKFQRLMVKAAANDNYPFETGGAHIRDSYIQTLSQLVGLDMDVRSSTNCIVYVNGDYWGVYDLREKVDDKDYTRYYYNQRRKYKGSEEYVQFLKTWGGTVPKYGEQRAVQDWAHLRNFISNNNMGDSANFAYVNSLLNMESFIDHKVYNSIIVSRDWLNYNTGWWRGLHPSGGAQKWRYILWDTEAALGHFHNYTGIPNTSATAPPCQVENITVGNGHAQSLLKLINENPDVWHHYVSRYADLLNTHLSCDNMIHVLDSMVNVIAPEMPRQIARWGGNINTWQNNVQNVRDFINQRCTALIQGLINCYNLTGPYDVHFQVEPPMSGEIKMNTVWLPHDPFDAFVFGGMPTKLEARGFGPYQLSHWQVGNHVVSPSNTSPEIILSMMQNDTITAHFYNPNLHGKELLYYWHFNELETPQDVTSIDADYKLLSWATPQMTYQGIGPRDIDVYNTGSDLNLQLTENAGKAARVRNPSINRPLVFNMPTTGYGNLLFEYAVHRSGNGMLNNIISYSIDGVNYTQAGLTQNTFSIDEDYKLVSIDFSGITDVNNNPDFHVKIIFDGNHNQINGNNRFDNITLKGELFTPAAYVESLALEISVYPNPFSDEVVITATEDITVVELYDLKGQLVRAIHLQGQKSQKINMGDLTAGMYFAHIIAGSKQHKVKLIKQ